MLTKAASYEELTARFRWQIPEHYNIGVDACDKWAESDRLALIHLTDDGKETRYSFKDLKRLSNRCANVLETQGVEEGDRVAILLAQGPETAIAHLAAYKLGAIAVPLFTLFGEEALQYRLANSGAKVVITDQAGLAKLDAIRDELPALETIISIDGGDALDWHRLLERASDGFLPVDTLANDPAAAGRPLLDPGGLGLDRRAAGCFAAGLAPRRAGAGPPLRQVRSGKGLQAAG